MEFPGSGWTPLPDPSTWLSSTDMPYVSVALKTCLVKLLDDKVIVLQVVHCDGVAVSDTRRRHPRPCLADLTHHPPAETAFAVSIRHTMNHACCSCVQRAAIYIGAYMQRLHQVYTRVLMVGCCFSAHAQEECKLTAAGSYRHESIFTCISCPAECLSCMAGWVSMKQLSNTTLGTTEQVKPAAGEGQEGALQLPGGGPCMEA